MHKLIKKLVKKFVRSEVSSLKKQIKTSEEKIDALCFQIQQLRAISNEIMAHILVYKASSTDLTEKFFELLKMMIQKS